MIVALLALAVALGGSAYAVSRISGTTIKPRSIPADRIRRNALGGTEINEARLGRVNEAKNATSSKFALRSSSAASADNALNSATARSADTLGGNPVGAFQTRIRWALVSSTGSVIDQSGGVGSVTHTLATGLYVVDFGTSLAGKALLVTPNGTGTSGAAAAPCGGALPGAASCAPPSANDGNHARVQLDAQGAFYVAVVG